ncbi:hypothetical protein BV898_03022 [Hypsibius exemplaris]|uniref:Sushi domain-containing protein n=1 Tax=Hypsibius exemplaris TaxID=2072580 RepID=A0A1W0X6U4_HYPEX|nr:hypothetical protein BV898_03022 [Hypsibius exemplaris]
MSNIFWWIFLAVVHLSCLTFAQDGPNNGKTPNSPAGLNGITTDIDRELGDQWLREQRLAIALAILRNMIARNSSQSESQIQQMTDISNKLRLSLAGSHVDQVQQNSCPETVINQVENRAMCRHKTLRETRVKWGPTTLAPYEEGIICIGNAMSPSPNSNFLVFDSVFWDPTLIFLGSDCEPLGRCKCMPTHLRGDFPGHPLRCDSVGRVKLNCPKDFTHALVDNNGAIDLIPESDTATLWF